MTGEMEIGKKYQIVKDKRITNDVHCEEIVLVTIIHYMSNRL